MRKTRWLAIPIWANAWIFEHCGPVQYCTEIGDRELRGTSPVIRYWRRGEPGEWDGILRPSSPTSTVEITTPPARANWQFLSSRESPSCRNRQVPDAFMWCTLRMIRWARFVIQRAVFGKTFPLMLDAAKTRQLGPHHAMSSC